MDNVFRGGFPIQLEQDKMFYIYSRKYGDLEREYNYFCMEADIILKETEITEILIKIDAVMFSLLLM
ncbi:MAG: hypothetical protein PWP07_1314 [Epulopiscium sp.]|jgi:hypothetical protein|uniref:hypothetical protein n=1 Tax=Defluviitalea raffinosedens TaxID=1450156 RepID=UPI0019594633|nr:hypothetical protein [Defluviitalea raffinosedens]MBM7686819.1 hypothetical protein [Defluviitalea raffinosedens]MDK2788089.1 hypothetical protein [Candidatus Epulonipiscium sp.]